MELEQPEGPGNFVGCSNLIGQYFVTPRVSLSQDRDPAIRDQQSVDDHDQRKT